MHIDRYFAARAATLALCGLLAGCATRADFGDTLDERGAAATTIARDYARGEKLVAAGKKDVRQGKDMIAKGDNRMERGEDRIREGEALMAAAREDHCRAVGYDAPECR